MKGFIITKRVYTYKATKFQIIDVANMMDKKGANYLVTKRY